MSTVIVTTDENTTGGLVVGGSLLVTSTGACIDANGAGLNYEASSAAPVALTIDGLVYGAGDGIDLVGNGSGAQVFVNGMVQGGEIGMLLYDGNSASGTPTINIGAPGSLEGGAVGIQCETGLGAVIDNAGFISGGTGSAIVATSPNDGPVALTNSGVIQGRVYLNTISNSDVINSGTIDGLVSVSGNITNTGTIDGGVQVSLGNLFNSGLIAGDSGYVVGSVTNTGTISGGLQISAGSLTNTGTFEDGVTLVDGTNPSNIVNHGTIDGGIALAGAAGGANTISNTGTIDGGIDLSTGSSDTITNTHGMIGGVVTLGQYDTMTNSDGAIGSGLVLAYGDAVSNSGTIDGGIYGNGAEMIRNAGTITGGFTDYNAATDTIDNLGRILGAINLDSSHLTNSGTILGRIDLGAQSTLDNSGTIAGQVIFTGSDDTVTNSGTIHGLVTLGTGDSFTNSGAIHGGLDLGAGDTLDTSTGSVTGHIVASTSDTFDFSGSFGKYEIVGFVPVAGHATTFDVIDFASDDFTSYAELQSHMAQVGKDVVITLDATDDIVLVGVKLTTLNTHDFLFT